MKHKNSEVLDGGQKAFYSTLPTLLFDPHHHELTHGVAKQVITPSANHRDDLPFSLDAVRTTYDMRLVHILHREHSWEHSGTEGQDLARSRGSTLYQGCVAGSE